eukprot:TRINITY_DN4109_c0_g1_i1.p1 TRINITY_DN4109_c0_g1~~TRINITY_DN4109_c0_g1_i1.p1  ORF type:complete len:441 (+),score=82.43 TRINITY_DN4109_c0_g1_i1:33-1355(+)
MSLPIIPPPLQQQRPLLPPPPPPPPQSLAPAPMLEPPPLSTLPSLEQPMLQSSMVSSSSSSSSSSSATAGGGAAGGNVPGNAKKGGRVPGSKGYTENETLCLLDLVGKFLPRHKASAEWDLLQQQYNSVAAVRGWTMRDTDSLRGRFHRLVHHNKKSDDPSCPRFVVQARTLYHMLENSTSHQQQQNASSAGSSSSSSMLSLVPGLRTPLFPQQHHHQHPIVIDEDSSDSGTEADVMPRTEGPSVISILDCQLSAEGSVGRGRKRKYSCSSLLAADMPSEKRPSFDNIDVNSQAGNPQTKEEYYAELERQNAYYQTVNDMMAATIQLQQQQYQLQIQALMQAHVRLWNMAFNPFINSNSLPVSPVGSQQLQQISTPPPPISSSSGSCTNLRPPTSRPEPPSTSTTSAKPQPPCISPTESMFTRGTHSSHSLELTDSDNDD